MEDQPPEHHIHHTLENIKAEAEANPDAPVTKSLAHKITFLEKNCTDYAIKSAKTAEKYAYWAMWAAIISALFGLFQFLSAFVNVCR